MVAGLVSAFMLAVPGTTGAATPPSLMAACGDASGVEAQPFYVRTADGVDLYSIDVGSGSAAIVLVHESPADLCGWLPYIPSWTSAPPSTPAAGTAGASSRPRRTRLRRGR
jgi:hypothetical protein